MTSVILIQITCLALMFLPLRLLAIELQRRDDCWKTFLQYQSALEKVENNSLRLKFIDSCIKSDVIPRFLRFRVLRNGCFDDKSIHAFQKGLLRKELNRARLDLQHTGNMLNERRQSIKDAVPEKLRPSVALYSRIKRRLTRQDRAAIHNKKLLALSEEQEKPLFNVKNTVIAYQLDTAPPKYVMETLSLRNSNQRMYWQSLMVY